MRSIIPFLSSVWAVSDLVVVPGADNLALEYTLNNDTSATYTVSYQDYRSDHGPLNETFHPVIDADAGSADNYVINGLSAGRIYRVTVFDNLDNSTATQLVRTTGRAIYVNYVDMWSDTGKRGGTELKGVIFYDEDTACFDQFRLTFLCPVDSVVADLPDDQVRRYDGPDDTAHDFVVTSRAGNGVGANRGSFTFTATFTNSTDACWSGVLDDDDTQDYYAKTAHGAVTIDDSTVTNRVTGTSIPITGDMDSAIIDNAVDGFNNTLADGTLMQNQTEGLFSYNVMANHNATYARAVCGFRVEIQFDAACTLEDFYGQLGGEDFVESAANKYEATANMGETSFYFLAKVSSPTALAGCTAAVLPPTEVKIFYDYMDV